jgi:hypothetical protein
LALLGALAAAAVAFAPSAWAKPGAVRGRANHELPAVRLARDGALALAGEPDHESRRRGRVSAVAIPAKLAPTAISTAQP